MWNAYGQTYYHEFMHFGDGLINETKYLGPMPDGTKPGQLARLAADLGTKGKWVDYFGEQRYYSTMYLGESPQPPLLHSTSAPIGMMRQFRKLSTDLDIQPMHMPRQLRVSIHNASEPCQTLRQNNRSDLLSGTVEAGRCADRAS